MCRIHSILASIVLLVATCLTSATASRAAELIMLEQQACEWCEMWHAQIGPIYPKTEEGRRAPLRQVDIHGSMPEDLPGIRSDHFTPTFILVENGKEMGRIRGYPGEDFFWGLLGRMIKDLDEAQAKQSALDTQTRQIQ